MSDNNATYSAAIEAAKESAVYRDCELLLNSWEDKFKDNPSELYDKLCLLALEREQLVSFAYQDDILSRSIAKLNLDESTEELFNYCLLQLWRDEEAHTIFIRGIIADSGKLHKNASTLIQQFAGLLSGWSASMKHHVPRSEARFRSLIVDGLALGGRIVGKLSPELKAELGYKTFKEYCTYNVDAEETAQLCWRRLVELDQELNKGNLEEFRRITTEEAEHGKIFSLLSNSINDSNQLCSDWNRSTFLTELENIGSRFVHPSYRTNKLANSSMGKGGTVHVLGEEQGSKHDAVLSQLKSNFQNVTGKNVAIKTSWMMGYSLDDPSSVTDPALLKTVVGYFNDAGAAAVTLIESPNIYSNIYENHTVEFVADYFGISKLEANIEDTSKSYVPIENDVPLGPKTISKSWAGADIRISLCHLRSHPTEGAHLTSANLEGLIEGTSSSVFWNRSYEYFVGASTVGIEAPPHAAIVDAWENCPDGWFGIMAGRQPKAPKRIYFGTDCLAVDLTVLSHTNPNISASSPTLNSLTEWFGDPTPHTNVAGHNEPIEGWRSPHRSQAASIFSDFACKVYAWASREGAVFTPKMDPVFIENKPIPSYLKPVRSFSRIILGLRAPEQSK